MTLISLLIATVTSTSALTTKLEAGTSNHGFAGWSHTTVNNPATDRCETEADCVLIDGEKQYLGPMTSDDGGRHIFGRVISCDENAILTVSYNLASCADGVTDLTSTGFTTNDKTFALLPGYGYTGDSSPGGVRKVPISGTDELEIATDECLNEGMWKTQSVKQTLGSVQAGCVQQLEIRTFLTSASQHAYIYDVMIECNADSGPGFCASDGGASPLSLNAFCLQGTGTKADGYYELISQDNANPAEPDTYGADYWVWVGDQQENGDTIYLYELNRQWVFGLDYQSTSMDGVYLVCSGDNGIDHDRVQQMMAKCDTFKKPNGDGTYSIIPESAGAAIAADHCPDSYATANLPSLVNFLQTALGSQQYVDIAMLVVLCVLCCVLGMVTCYGCQWLCYHCGRNRKYRQVASKEVDDIDF